MRFPQPAMPMAYPSWAELIEKLAPFELLQPRRETHSQAARLTDKCLRKGVTPSTVGVLIAQLAIERDCTLLTADADFRAIACCVRLKLAPAVS